MIVVARQRSGWRATPSLDPVFVALNHGELPIRARSGGNWPSGCAVPRTTRPWVPGVVVELQHESHAAKPSARAWAIARRADRGHRLAGQRIGRVERRQANRTSHTDPRRGGWLPMPAEPIHPDQLAGEMLFRADLTACLDSLPIGDLAGLLSELPSSCCSGACCMEQVSG